MATAGPSTIPASSNNVAFVSPSNPSRKANTPYSASSSKTSPARTPASGTASSPDRGGNLTEADTHDEWESNDPSPARSSYNKKGKAASSSDPSSKQRRKKANRACYHCQRAHLTCDDSRPCERCVKKGLEDSCIDGARKKAKYLLEDDELEEIAARKAERKPRRKAGRRGKVDAEDSEAYTGLESEDWEEDDHEHSEIEGSHRASRVTFAPTAHGSAPWDMSAAAALENVQALVHQQHAGAAAPYVDGSTMPGVVNQLDLLSNPLFTEGMAGPASSAGHVPQSSIADLLSAAAHVESLPATGASSSVIGTGSYYPDTSGHSGPINAPTGGSGGGGMGFSPHSHSSSQDLHVFGSETASLEYHILSTMLHGIDPTLLATNSPDWISNPHMGIDNLPTTSAATAAATQHAAGAYPLQMPPQGELGPPGGAADFFGAAGWGSPFPPLQVGSPLPQHATSSAAIASRLGAGAGTSLGVEDAGPVRIAALIPTPVGTPLPIRGMDDVDPPPVYSEPVPADGNHKVKQEPSGASSSMRSADPVNPSAAAVKKTANAAALSGLTTKIDHAWRERVATIYRAKTKPFPYPEGYHFLIKHVTGKFPKADVLRIVRALAIFRPSLIALQMPLTEEDEIFVERSLQREMLEFEKLISFSGTPTVVWRRTCEICVVGAEFSMLTQWKKEDLVGRYIYEFFDKDSTLEYWEKFALHAFENTHQSVMTTCVLLTPTGKPVPCSVCFSIKRDIFDLPALVVGNFLPHL